MSTDLYVLPRLGVLGGHEHKACKSALLALRLSRFLTPDPVVPYTRIFDPPSGSGASSSSSTNQHLVLKAHVKVLSPKSVTLDRTFPEYGLTRFTIPFAYCIYALGSRMPIPIDLWSHDPNAVTSQPGKTAVAGECEGATAGMCCRGKGKCEDEYNGTKQQGIDWLKRCQKRIERAGSVLCVGGGALGIRELHQNLLALLDPDPVGLPQSSPRTSSRFTLKNR